MATICKLKPNYVKTILIKLEVKVKVRHVICTKP